MEQQPNVGSDPQMMISGMKSNMIKKPYKVPGIRIQDYRYRDDGNGINTVSQGSSNLMLRVGRSQDADESDTSGYFWRSHFGGPVV